MISHLYKIYTEILREEMITALGCTEPIAIALAASCAREVLGEFPDRAEIYASGNIIKNAMGVVVPNSGGQKGIKASVIAGLLCSNPKLKLEVLSEITPDDVEIIKTLSSGDFCTIKFLESDSPLHISVIIYKDEASATAEIKYSHTNVYRILKNDELLYIKSVDDVRYPEGLTDRSLLNISSILEYVESADLSETEELISREWEYNMAIAKEGMNGSYGLGIGPKLRCGMGDSLWTEIKAYTAAASEARMSGSIMPVVTNSGSGNQGITCSVPLIIYGTAMKIPSEKIHRALILSNLINIYQKSKIGRLSAFCGAVSAACAAGAGLTYLAGGKNKEIIASIQNTLANSPGIICDGAKPSCAAKISTSLDAAITGHILAMQGVSYEAGSGILKESAEKTIEMIGNMASIGMAETDNEIIKIMLEK